MAQFVGPIQGPLGSVQGRPEVRNAVMATTTVEFLGGILMKTKLQFGSSDRDRAQGSRYQLWILHQQCACEHDNLVDKSPARNWEFEFPG